MADPIKCSPTPADRRRMKRSGKRVCRVEGCDTILSAYNPSDICGPCNQTIREPVRTRGR